MERNRETRIERHNWRRAESVQRLVEILVRDKEDFKEKKGKESLLANNRR